MISCSEAVRQLWKYLEDELTSSDRARVEEHLVFCRTCCGEVEFAKELRRLIEEAATPNLPPAVEERLTGFLEELENKGAS